MQVGICFAATAERAMAIRQIPSSALLHYLPLNSVLP